MIRRFNRYELKYVIHVFQKKALVEDLRHFVELDSHGDVRGRYPVTSLYYDSPGFDFYRSKVDGIRFRRKVRLRVYPAGGPGAVTDGMVEIKQRINRTVQKRRVRLPLDRAYELCEGDLEVDSFSGLDRETASEVQYIVRTMQLRPVCVISYHRQAFVGSRYEPGLRITFDTSLKSRTHGLRVEEKAVNHYFLSPSWCILEVKVNDFIPTWVNALLAKHGCMLQRVSKYCAGLETCRSIRVRELRPRPAG
jgi:SPX domain protein involved in polyphosphate accumulation